jgi:hypothetical protein
MGARQVLTLSLADRPHVQRAAAVGTGGRREFVVKRRGLTGSFVLEEGVAARTDGVDRRRQISLNAGGILPNGHLARTPFTYASRSGYRW